TLQYGAPLATLRFNSSGSQVVAASTNGSVRVWDVQTGTPRSIQWLPPEPLLSMDLTLDGSYVVTVSAGHTARVWSSATARPVTDVLRQEGGIDLAAFSPDSMRVVTASQKTAIAWIWDATTSRQSVGPLRHDATPIFTVQFTPDGTRV